jgi:hypothetical protein
LSDVSAVESTTENDVVDEPEFDAYSAAEVPGAVSGSTDVVSAIKGLNNPDSAFYTSIKGGSFADRKAIAAAVTSSQPIDEHLGETLSIINVIVLPVDLADAQGEVNTQPRVILIDSSGVAYHATSVGLLSAIRNIFATLGEPDEWPEPLDLKVVQQKGNRGFKFFTINLA